MNEEKIRNLIFSFLMKYEIHQDEKMKEGSLLKMVSALENKAPEIYNKLVQLVNDFQAYEFLRKDREMKIKLQDIWQAECERAKQSLEAAYGQILASLPTQIIDE